MENLSPQIIRRVAKEMSDLVAHPPEGIRVVMNDEDVTDIQAFIDGPGEYFLNIKLLGIDVLGGPKDFILHEQRN